ncbi:MAG: RIP metalloprotease RseP [candidate division Zixibacteria bacterium]|nr:RIP metalloprotease RseP [candidate division Zixibacteria bacterium]MDH3937204.1 RIP metalloprotease RseP [candidate division Zixibacteria bacterium]MDH4034572.1 RIP metalloprotease RseP [candidate division Zixibacteria bacterium]
MVTIASFIFVLGILIFIHELGHFLVAKKAGIRVEKFSLGFPPNIFKHKVGDTTYCIGLIPLGGYVKMAGDNPLEETAGAPDEFLSKPIAHRAAVIFAGPFMNYVLAMVVSFGLFAFGGGEFITDPDRVMIGQIQPDSPAELAGLQTGDQIISVDGHPVSSFDSLRYRIYAKPAQAVELVWLHDNDTLSTSAVTAVRPLRNAEGGVDSVGQLGFTEMTLGRVQYSLGEALVQAVNDTHWKVAATAFFLKEFITGNISSKAVGGPIFIAQLSGEQARRGAYALFNLIALLSINLAVLNVLPIPILDGGHLVFLAIEKIRGKTLSIKARTWAQQIGLVAILGLILMVTYNDIARLFLGY